MILLFVPSQRERTLGWIIRDVTSLTNSTSRLSECLIVCLRFSMGIDFGVETKHFIWLDGSTKHLDTKTAVSVWFPTNNQPCFFYTPHFHSTTSESLRLNLKGNYHAKCTF